MADANDLMSKASPYLQSAEELVAQHSSDTYYRLRYATMQYDYVSPAIERLLGYTPAEFRALKVRSLIEETRMVPRAMQRITEFSPLEEARRKGEVARWHADYRMRTKAGSHVWVSDISYPWLDDTGAIIGSVGCLRDITERVESELLWQEERLRMANQDWLTGLYHRGFFFDRMEEETRRVRRSQADLALAVIDIDHFRRVNDMHGSHAGDFVLKEVAKRISSCLRDTDIAARIGGEEYGILLPDTSLEGAFWVAERIRHAVSAKPIVASDTAVVNVTVSIGLAEADYDGKSDSASLYRSADTRLYIAKHSGRNQVSMDELVHMH